MTLSSPSVARATAVPPSATSMIPPSEGSVVRVESALAAV